MESTFPLIEVLGLLAILACAALVFVSLAQRIVKKRGNAIRFGFELLLLFSVSYLFADLALSALGWRESTEDFRRAVAFLWWISLAFTINACIKRFVWEGLLARDHTHRAPKLITDGVALLIYAAAIMVVMHFVYEEPITAVLATSGVAALVFGLAAQSTLSEVFSGIALNSTKALRVGDYVEIDGIYGQVFEVNWRSVSLLNPHTGSLYIFPNSAVASRIILNYDEPTGLFKHKVTFVVEYSASPELVIRTVLEELEHARFVRRDPKPDFNVLGFTDLGMEYRVRYYFDGDDPWWDAQNEVCMAIWSSLRRRGLRLAVDRHKLQSGDEVAGGAWAESFGTVQTGQPPLPDLPGRVRRVPILSDLSNEDIQSLCDAAHLRDYTPPNCVYHRGDCDDWVYFIDTGQVIVVQTQENGVEATVGTFQSGEIFGLDRLISDAARPHTLQALQYSTIYLIPCERVRQLFDQNPSLSDKIAADLNAKNRQYREQSEALAEEHGHREHRRHRMHLIRHIRQDAEAIFAQPFIQRLKSVVTHSTGGHSVFEAVMAACALVCSSRGVIDDAERSFVSDTLSDLDIFKHADRLLGLKAFESYSQDIHSAGQAGIDRAMDAVRIIAGDEHMAHVVLAIAHGMTGVHDRVSPRETAMIERIAEVLGVSPEIGDSVVALTAHRKVSRHLLHTAKDTVRKHSPRRYTKGQKP